MSDMDKILRQKLYDHESTLPDHLWTGIQAGLSEKRDKRGFIWMWLGGIFLAGILGAFFLYVNVAPSVESSFSNFQDDEIVSNLRVLHMESADEVIFTETNAEVYLGDQPPVVNGHVYSSAIPIQLEGKDREKVISNKEKESIYLIPNAEAKLSSSDYLERKDKVIHNDQHEREIVPSSKMVTLQPEIIDLKERIFPDPIGCANFSQRMRINIFGEGYYKPLYIRSMLGTNSPEISADYIQQRSNTESTLYSWAAGGYIGWISRYDIGAKVGVEYEVNNERFTYEDPDAIRNQTVITIDTTFNQDGTFQTTSDTSIVQLSGTELQKIHNYHKTISIPLHVMYHFAFDNFALELSGGPIINLSYMNRGKILDTTNEDRWFTKGESGTYDIYKDRLNVSFSLSASMLYSLNENIQLFIRPTIKYTPTSIARSSSPFTQRYLNSGLAIGARYYISGNPNY